jgi:hypothetical protein
LGSKFFGGLEVVEAAPVLNVKRTKPRLPIHDQAIQFVKELFEKEAPATHAMAVDGYMKMDAYLGTHEHLAQREGKVSPKLFHHDPAIIGNRRGDSAPKPRKPSGTLITPSWRRRKGAGKPIKGNGGRRVPFPWNGRY